MTSAEKESLMSILSRADGGCSPCIQALVRQSHAAHLLTLSDIAGNSVLRNAINYGDEQDTTFDEFLEELEGE